MSGSRRIVLNTAFLFSAEMLNPLTSTLLVAMIGRNYGVAGLGQYSLVLTFYFTAVMLSFIVVTIVVRLLDYPAEVQAASAVMMWGVFPTVITSFTEAIFLAFEKAKYVAFLSVAENVAKVALGMLAIWTGHGMVFLFWILLALRILACIANLAILRSQVCRLKMRLDFSALKELVHVTPVFSINLLLTVLFGRVDVILLSKLAGFTAVGLYSAAQRIILLLLTLSISFKRAIFPPLCARWSVSPADTKRMYQMSIKYTAILGGFAVVGVAQLGSVVLTLLYGKSFGDAHVTLLIMSAALIPGFVFPVCAALLVAVNWQSLDLAGSIVRLVLLVGLNFALVGRFDHVGAGIAFSVASLVFLVLQQACVNWAAFPAGHMQLLWRPVAAAVATSVGFIPVSWFAPWWVSAPIAFVVYWVALFMLGAFSIGEWAVLVNFVSSLRGSKASPGKAAFEGNN